MLKNLTTILVTALLVLCFTICLAAEEWEICKQFDFNDQLSQIVVLDMNHGYILADHSVWEFSGNPPVWTRKADLPERDDPENPGEKLSYTTYRMIAWGDTVVVVASKGSIFYSTDAASNWTDISDTTYLDVAFNWVHGLDANHFWVCGGTSSPKKGYVIKVENLAEPTFTRLDNEDMDYKLSVICLTDALHGHTVTSGTKGDYFRTVDGGETWKKIAGNFKGGTSGRIYEMAFASQNVGYAAGYYGYLYKTVDGGDSIWQQIETPEYSGGTNTHLPALCVLSEQELWFGGKEGRMFYSDDGAASITAYQIQSGNDFDSFWFSSATQGIVMAESQIFHTLSGSVNWKPVTNWVGETWQATAVVGDDKLCLVTDKGMYSYGAIDDLPMPGVAIPDKYPTFYNVCFANGKGFLLGKKTVMLTDDDGATWTEVVNADSGLGKTVYDMAFVDENIGYFGDSGGTLWKTSDGGAHWAADTALGSNLYRILLADSQNWYILDYKDEQIYKTTDGGTTWATISVTENKSSLYDMELVDDSTLVIAGYDASTSGASKAYLLRSTDYGETWTEVFHEELAYGSTHLYSVEFNGLLGYASGNYGIVLISEDGGLTWNEDPTPVAGEKVYLHDGKFLPNGDYYVVGSKGYVFKKTAATGVDFSDGNAPYNFALDQNYPNPFNPSTEISYSLPASSKVTLSIYNSLGQKIATLVEAKKAAGKYRVSWEARNASSGIYFARFHADGFSKTIKMLLLR